jgi:hypothetical protein
MVMVKDLTELAVDDLWREIKGQQDWGGGVRAMLAELEGHSTAMV